MSVGAVWQALKLPALIAAITAWSLIAALFSDDGVEIFALVLLSGVVGVVVAKLYRGVRRR